MNQAINIIGIITAVFGIEAAYRMYRMVRIFAGGDTPFYLFTIIAFIIAIIAFGLSLAGNLRNGLKVTSLFLLFIACMFLLIGPGLGMVRQALIMGVITLICLVCVELA